MWCLHPLRRCARHYRQQCCVKNDSSIFCLHEKPILSKELGSKQPTTTLGLMAKKKQAEPMYRHLWPKMLCMQPTCDIVLNSTCDIVLNFFKLTSVIFFCHFYSLWVVIIACCAFKPESEFITTLLLLLFFHREFKAKCAYITSIAKFFTSRIRSTL